MVVFFSVVFYCKVFSCKKHPELKGKVNGVIFVPLISLLFSYFLYYGGDEMLNKTLPNIDKLRYASTYTPYMGYGVDAAVRIAQDMGYMSDELVSRSSEFESAMGQAGFTVFLAVLSIIGAIVWVLNIGLYLLVGKNNLTIIKMSSIATWVFLFLGGYFLFSSLDYIYGAGEDSGFPIFVIIAYAPIVTGLMYWYNKSYKKIKQFVQ